MRHLGDIKNIDGAEIEPVDVITGGSPCQDLSCAGKRAGLAGERSGLFMEQVRIVREMRENDRRNGRPIELLRPRYMVWENVTGAISSNKGKDFRAVLTEIVKIAEPEAPDVPMPEGIYGGKWPKAGCLYGEMGDWSVAWRVHDAQYWGVPQRRKRIAVVADFNGLTAGEILFDPQYRREAEDPEPVKAVRNPGGEPGSEVRPLGEGVPRHPEQGGAQGEEAAGEAGSGTPETGEPCLCLNDQGGSVMEVSEERTGTLRAQEHGHQPIVYRGDSITSPVNKSKPEPGICHTLVGDGRNYLVQDGAEKPGNTAVVFGISSYDSNAMKSDNPDSGFYEAETSRTLDNNGGNPSCNQGGMIVLEGNGSRPSHKGDGYAESETMYTLNATEHHDICAGFKHKASGMAGSVGYQKETAPSLTAGQESAVYIAFAQNQRDEVRDLNDKAGALSAEPGMKQQTFVYDARGNGDGSTVPTIAGDHENRVTDYTAIVAGYKGFGDYQITDVGKSLLKSDDVTTGDLVYAVDCRNGTENPSVNGTLQAKEIGQNLNSNNVCRVGSHVRRLTPLECTRLQGFPDGWVDIGEWTDGKGKKRKDADAPKYRALGNSIALPFWQWLARRICSQYERDITMGSLFDGIGGFPLAFERCGAKAVWASEVDEFCMAVTKKRFGDEGHEAI